MTTIVVGGGWSGLATAVRLTQMGETVHLLEAAKQLGGRARNVAWQGLEIDNGQHLMIGAYQHTLDLLNVVGAKESELFRRKPLQLSIHHPDYSPLHIEAGHFLPWPLSVARRLWQDNGFAVFKQVSRLLIAGSRLTSKPDIDVHTWLQQHKQSSRLIAQLWEPLCLAMLNTPIKEASAKIFARVLTETFKSRHNTDLLLPTRGLGDSLPFHAEVYIQKHGGKISPQTRVRKLSIKNGKVEGVIINDGSLLAADNVVIATPPSVSQALLMPHIPFTAPDSYPIATVYLQYPAHTQLPEPIIGLSGTLSQWLFERHELRPGLIAVVISGPGKHEQLDKKILVERVSQELKQVFPSLPEKADDSLVIREKRATFACTVDIEQQRPNNRTEISGLWLSGDYVSNSYPATLEGAVINGEQTATQLIEHLSISR